MAIFGKDRAQQGTSIGSTIVAADSKFVGNLALKDTLHVDGRIDGDIESESGVVIGQHGHVHGQIQAETVVVSGHVDGSISASRLEIIAGGCVEGDVHIVDLVIEPGGRFNGSSEILASHATDVAASGNTGDGPKAQAGEGIPSDSPREKAADGVGNDEAKRSPSTA